MSEEQTTTEYDVRYAAQSYGTWYGVGLGLWVGGATTSACFWATLPGLAPLALSAVATLCWWRWRRAWKAYRAKSDARHAAVMRALTEAHAAEMRALGALQAGLVKAVGGLQ